MKSSPRSFAKCHFSPLPLPLFRYWAIICRRKQKFARHRWQRSTTVLLFLEQLQIQKIEGGGKQRWVAIARKWSEISHLKRRSLACQQQQEKGENWPSRKCRFFGGRRTLISHFSQFPKFFKSQPFFLFLFVGKWMPKRGEGVWIFICCAVATPPLLIFLLPDINRTKRRRQEKKLARWPNRSGLTTHPFPLFCPRGLFRKKVILGTRYFPHFSFPFAVNK